MNSTRDSQHRFILDQIGDNFFKSFLHGKYIIADNIDSECPLKIEKSKKIFNDAYHIIIVVTSGTLNLTINNISVTVEENSYIAIMPGIIFNFEECECRFFMQQVQSYIMQNIHDETDSPIEIRKHYFTFHHVIFSQQDVDALYRNYLKTKYVMKLSNYQLKEFACKAYFTLYLSLIHHIMQYKQEISYTTGSHKEVLFNKFLDMLGENYKKERSVNYYADRLAITTKYLSSITSMFTGVNASKLIDGFVTMQIIVRLYKNNNPIKDISKEFNFPTQSFFGRYFKRVTGIGPRDFIKKNCIKISH